ncbi:MAG: septum formation initiator family protein [Lachnospiraceae bacterium]|nr:septum formation initiator family protein [Lachnospiraceae bacterium]
MKTTRNNANEMDIRRRQSVITDNLARQAAEPAYRPQREENPRRARRQAEQAAPLLGIRKGMDFFACFVMLAGLLVVAFAVIQYTRVHAKSMELDKELTALNNEYVNLVRMNDEAEQEIARSVDLNRVYEVAVGQYGMVFPKDNEVITISFKNQGYVRQYGEIAAAEKPEQTVFESLMEKLMR